MLKAGGYSIITEPGQRNKEHDTYTCAHCMAVTFTKPGMGPLQVAVIGADASVRMVDAGFCRNCFRNICPKCMNQPHCTPYERTIEDSEKQARLILP